MTEEQLNRIEGIAKFSGGATFGVVLELVAEVRRLQAEPVQVNSYFHKDMSAEQLESEFTRLLREENQAMRKLLKQATEATTIKVGPFTIYKGDENSIWVQHENGESAQIKLTPEWWRGVM